MALLNDAEREMLHETRRLIQARMKKIFNESPKPLYQHAKDMGMNVSTMTRLLRTNSVIHPFTFSKVWTWLGENNALPTEEESEAWNRAYDVIKREKLAEKELYDPKV